MQAGVAVAGGLLVWYNEGALEEKLGMGWTAVDRHLDKATIFVLCAATYVRDRADLYAVVPVICAVIAGAITSYLEDDRACLALSLLFFAAGIAEPALLYFFPLLCYDVFCTRYRYWLFSAAAPFVAGAGAMPPVSAALVLAFFGLSWLMKYRTLTLERRRAEYIALRDSAKELSSLLERKNRELLEKQDYEIRLATLSERNRIARDIHDSVGHILVRAILQTGAMAAVCKDEATAGQLKLLKETLAQGMETLRESVHRLYDESVDLYVELKKLCDGFEFCEAELEWDVQSSPETNVVYALLAVVREALSNVARHSDATRVKVSLREHPALYQLVVRDNGAQKKAGPAGLGLKNIFSRVKSVGGVVNAGYDGGFTVFVSIPKQKGEGLP